MYVYVMSVYILVCVNVWSVCKYKCANVLTWMSVYKHGNVCMSLCVSVWRNGCMSERCLEVVVAFPMFDILVFNS